jgi:hypothetical protein
MVLTETLYSLRKRVRRLRLAGPMRYWLSAHIYMGIVGPFLVLTHTAFRFNGLAGFSMALTALVAGSGFFGRYLYTSVPRSLTGVAAGATELVADLKQVQAALSELAARRSAAVQALIEIELRRQTFPRREWLLVLLRAWDDWRYRSELRRQLQRLAQAGEGGLDRLERLLVQHSRLERQLRGLHSARRLLSVWHTAHVPMGLVLFAAMALHTVAAIFFRASP